MSTWSKLLNIHSDLDVLLQIFSEGTKTLMCAKYNSEK